MEGERRWSVDGVRVEVGEESVFSPYYSRVTRLPLPSPPPGLRAVSSLFSFQNGWLPMRAANEIALPRRERGQHQGAYLHDNGRWWWVTQRWQAGSISASSTHIAEFALFEDQSPPTIGAPYWDQHPAGPRLVIPFREKGSGLRRLSAMVRDKSGSERTLLLEVQRAWGRALWRPRAEVRQALGEAQLLIKVQDRSRHEAERLCALPSLARGTD